MKYIYIASPYTKGDLTQNLEAHIDAANKLANAGFTPFAPLLFHWWDKQHPHTYEFWCKQGLDWIEKCDAVVRLPGDSSGADAEVDHALDLHIPVFLTLETFFTWAEAFSK
jgi:hypothetical protein